MKPGLLGRACCHIELSWSNISQPVNLSAFFPGHSEWMVAKTDAKSQMDNTVRLV
jgi:hypothetical protein